MLISFIEEKGILTPGLKRQRKTIGAFNVDNIVYLNNCKDKLKDSRDQQRKVKNKAGKNESNKQQPPGYCVE